MRFMARGIPHARLLGGTITDCWANLIESKPPFLTWLLTFASPSTQSRSCSPFYESIMIHFLFNSTVRKLSNTTRLNSKKPIRLPRNPLPTPKQILLASYQYLITSLLIFPLSYASPTRLLYSPLLPNSSIR